MIKASALLVALAIGLLVAGVVASSLPMVYVSIGVCALAGLLLAAGVLSHWSEIFGRREPRPATPGAWSEPQVNVTAPVLASIQAVAAARASGRPMGEEAHVPAGGPRLAGGRPGSGRPSGGPPDSTRAPGRPADAVPSPAEIAGRGDESPASRRSDDLWERVEEELGSAAKRDTGALSWPGTVFPPLAPDVPESAESAVATPEAEPHGAPVGEPHGAAGAWLGGSGTGVKPAETAESGDPRGTVGTPVPDETPGTTVPDETAAGAAADADVAQDAEAAPDDGVVADDEAVPDTGPAPEDEAVPDTEDREAADREAAEPPDAKDPAAGEPAAEEPAVEEPAVEEPAAEEPAVKEPGPDAPEPAAEEPSGDGAAATPAPGRVEVTVVPGVARYHRAECILIRFLGPNDLDVMTRPEAVDAKFVACRACQPEQD